MARFDGGSGVIVCVCANPAEDVTYQVSELAAGSSHRVQAVVRRAGGKGINVARVLHQLGERAVVTGLAGGARGAAVAADLRAAGVSCRWAPTSGSTRQTVSVVDERDATVFNEAGPDVTDAEWSNFVTEYVELIASASVVTLSGSVPPGVPDDAYAQLTSLAHGTGARVVVDADGALLRHALAAGPDVVKPNAAEAGRLLGRPVRDANDALAAAQAAREQGARAAVVSLGPDGGVACTPVGTFRFAPPYPVAGNPTGAGDALVAAVARGLCRQDSWANILRNAAAVSSAAVAVLHSGGMDADLAARLRPLVSVTEI